MLGKFLKWSATIYTIYTVVDGCINSISGSVVPVRVCVYTSRDVHWGPRAERFLSISVDVVSNTAGPVWHSYANTLLCAWRIVFVIVARK